MTDIKSGVERAIEAAGGVPRNLGEALNPPVTSQAVSQWKARGWVPPVRAMEIEQLFGIPRKDLLKPELAALVGTEDPAQRYI